MAQVEEPIPMLIFFALCITGCFTVQFVNDQQSKGQQEVDLKTGKQLALEKPAPKLYEIGVDKLKKKHLQLAKYD